MLSPKMTLNTSEYQKLEWPERLVHLRQFEFRIFEVNTMPLRPFEEVLALKTALKAANIKVAVAHDWYHFFEPSKKDEIDTCKKRFLSNLDRVAELGCQKIVWYTGDNSMYPGEKAIEPLLSRLEPIIKKAEKLGITMLLETEFSVLGVDVAGNAEILAKLMKTANHKLFKVNFDPGNIYTAGEEAFPYAYEKLKPWIEHVHIKDVAIFNPDVHPDDVNKQKGRSYDGRPIIAIPCAPGEGAINLDGLMKAMLADGYEGLFSLEPHVKFDNLDSTFQKGIEFLKRYLH